MCENTSEVESVYIPTQGNCVKGGKEERRRRRHLLKWSYYVQCKSVTFCLYCPHIIQFLFLILPSKHVQLVSQEEGGKGGGGGGEEEGKEEER